MCSWCIEVPGVTRGRQWIPGTGVIDNCEPSDVCTELNVLQKSNICSQLLSRLWVPQYLSFKEHIQAMLLGEIDDLGVTDHKEENSRLLPCA